MWTDSSFYSGYQDGLSNIRFLKSMKLVPGLAQLCYKLTSDTWFHPKLHSMFIFMHVCWFIHTLVTKMKSWFTTRAQTYFNKLIGKEKRYFKKEKSIARVSNEASTVKLNNFLFHPIPITCPDLKYSWKNNYCLLRSKQSTINGTWFYGSS